MRFYREQFLEDICLNVVAENFELYYLHSESSQKYIEFLQRRYSAKVYNLLKKNGMLAEKYNNWLISPFWKDVVIEKLYNLSHFISKLKIYGSGINSINLEKSSATREILSAVICCLPNLKSLNLNCTNCSDNLLLLIRKMCPLLYSLSLIDCNITNVGVKNLCYVNQEKVGFKSLKMLNIERTYVKPSGVAYILENLNLHVLKYHDMAPVMYSLYESIVSEISNVKTYELKEVEYFMNRHLCIISSISKSQIWAFLCPDVEKLTILDWLTDEDLHFFLKFPKLKSLTIIETPRKGITPTSGLSYFLELKGERLTELVLEDITVSTEVIVRVCYNLQRLSLGNINYEDFDEAAIKPSIHHLNVLTKLKIRNSFLLEKITYKSINLLLNCSRSIERLTVYCVKHFPEEFIDMLTTFPNLLKAKFVFTDVKESFAKKLFECKNITKLYLDGCPHIDTNECSEFFKLIHLSDHSNTISWQIEYS